MAVHVRIPEALRTLTGGSDMVSVEASNVRDMLEALEAQHGGLKERICDENGNVRRFVNIFVSEEDIRFLDNLDTHLDAGTEISILPAIAGGAAKKKKSIPAVSMRRVYLTFNRESVTRPIIYELIKKFDVIPNIRGASVTEEVGILSLELEGKIDVLDSVFNWLRKEGIKVDPIEMNVLEP